MPDTYEGVYDCAWITSNVNDGDMNYFIGDAGATTHADFFGCTLPLGYKDNPCNCLPSTACGSSCNYDDNTQQIDCPNTTITNCNQATHVEKPCAGNSGDLPSDINTDGYYCDTNNGNYCCEVEDYYDSSLSSCRDLDDCYDSSASSGSDGFCAYDFDTQQSQWWGDPDCYIAPDGCCFDRVDLGTDYYEYQSVTAY